MKTTLMTVLTVFMATSLWAQIYVTSTANAGAGTLRDAVANATPGTTIDMTGLSSPITLSSPIAIGMSLKFVGTPGVTTINGNGTTRLFSAGLTPGVVIEMEGLIVQNMGSGVVYAWVADLLVSNCIFRNNHLVFGGSPTTSSIITNGILNNFSFIDCTFENNSGNRSLIQSSASNEVTIIGCKFLNNSCGAAPVYIGGAHNSLVTQVQVMNCEFKGNSNTGSTKGGALALGQTFMDAEITNSVFTGNSAANDGGAIAILASWSNSAALDCRMTNLTISNNSAAVRGGGIVFQSSNKVAIGNCIIADNQSSVAQTEDLFLYQLPLSTMSSAGNNLVGIEPLNGAFSATNNDLLGNTTTPLDPLFVAPTTAPAPTVSGDYRLLHCSPARDAGKNANVPNDVNNYFGLGTTVQLSKDVNNENRFTGTVDIGAYEQSITTAGNFNYPSGHYHCPGLGFFAPNTGGLTGTFTSTPSGLVMDPTTGIINQKLSAPGTYIITFAAAPTACSPTGYVSTVTYHVLPALTVSISETISPFWPHMTSSLNAAVSGGSGSYSYVWQGGTTSSTHQVITPCAGVWYNLTVTDQLTGCTGYATYYFYNGNNPACRSKGFSIAGKTVNSNDWNVYPNPTSGTVTLDLNDVMDNFEVQVVDVTGQTVYRELVKESNRLEFDLSGQATGVYFVNVIAAEEKKSFKVILQ